MKKLLLSTAALAALVVFAGGASAQDKLRFALVPKGMNNPYFDLSRDGCMAAAEKLGIECVYIGPVEHEPATEVQIIQDLITQGIDGLAISVSDVDTLTDVINQAVEAGIPTITFDADAPGSKRQAYVGTDNYAMGKAIGEMAAKLKPEGGTYAMVSGGPAAENLNERVKGVIDGLGAGWTQVDGSPLYCNDDAQLAVQQLQDILTANPDITALLPVGGWPLFVPDAYRAFVEPIKGDLASGAKIIVSADTLPAELESLRDGYVNALIGQQPYAMGEQAMEILMKLHNGETVEEINLVGLDTVTPENVAEFMAK
jgi:ribose transport system substrate-binding protein